MGTELSGKTLAIVGCGRIGQVVAEWAQGFSMDVIGYDPAMPKEVAEAKGITLMELDDIWARADFITLHTPLTPETKDLVNDDSIAKMKKGVIIVNCARGGIINEDALLRGLQSGQVGSAALDVYSSEPPPESLRPLLEHDRVVCTPHLGASTEEAQVNVARDVALQMCDTLAGSDYVGVVNVSYMALANEPEMKPYLQLAEVIGKMHSQLHGDGDKVKSIKVHCYGGTSVSIESTQARQVLQAQVLKGVMAFHPGNTTVPSLINAPFLAKEHGVECVIDKKVHPRLLSSPYSNAITVDVVLESGRHRSISGSVFGTQGNIVQIDNYKGFPSFTPEGTLLSFRNVDKPGAVGGVLKILSEAGVNVGRMNVGRQDGDLALCLLDLDQMPSQQTIQKLRDLDTLKEVSLSNIS
jgi:D-3-phosphoglycerate dehydrogenase